MAKEINFYKNYTLVHTVMCECEPEDCPYLAYVKNNTDYSHWYRDKGRSVSVYLTDGCRGTKLRHPQQFCSKCFDCCER